MLQPVSETALVDIPGAGPAHDPVYQVPDGFDLADNNAFTSGQPFDYYQKLREEAPAAWTPVPLAAGYWAITRYEDVKRIELDPETFSSQRGGINMATAERGSGHERLAGAALDRPYHVPLRMQHRAFFTPDYIAELRKKVEVKVDALLDDMERNGPVVDMVKKFSEQLPLYTLCEMLGVDEKDRPKIIRWMHYLELAAHMLTEQAQGRKISYVFLAKFLWNVRQMFRFGERVLQDRRANPRDDLLTAIAQAEVDGEPLSQDFLDGAWLLIIFAGNDTTRNSLSGAMRLLTEFPDQKQKLLDEPALIKKMVPEAIRMVSPVIFMRRTLLSDAEIAGQKMSEGEKVIMYYGAANRDPSIFENPDKFDIERENSGDHLSFGAGPHVCLGQRVANMQLEVAYEKILSRFPNVKWTGHMRQAPNNFVNAISELEIDLGT
jgi:cytochrome P450